MHVKQYVDYFRDLASRLSLIRADNTSHSAFFRGSDTELLKALDKISFKGENYGLWAAPPVAAPLYKDSDNVMLQFKGAFCVFHSADEETYDENDLEHHKNQCYAIATQIMLRMWRDSQLLSRGIFQPLAHEATPAYKEGKEWLRYLDKNHFEIAELDPLMFNHNTGYHVAFVALSPFPTTLEAHQWQDM